ncbi:MAG: sortase [bacterium]|nr:sortase [bacterium]
MNKYYYTKSHIQPIRKYARYFGLALCLFGLSVLVYFSFPVATSYMLMERVYASQTVTTPIPAIKVLTTERIKNILAATINSVEQVDYTDAKQWFPSFEINPATPRVKNYLLSVPSIGIKNATVSTQDYNVGRHLVNYGGTAVPPDKGNAVIFGHSTLPQLFEQSNYKTIFAKLHTIKKGDSIIATVDGAEYTYKVTAIAIVSPSDFAPLMQTYNQSYLTLITCTPPGTTWERLVVKAVLSD